MKLYHLVPFACLLWHAERHVHGSFYCEGFCSFLFRKTRLLRNENQDSCEKQAIGTENTGIRRIPAGICNLGKICLIFPHYPWISPHILGFLPLVLTDVHHQPPSCIFHNICPSFSLFVPRRSTALIFVWKRAHHSSRLQSSAMHREPVCAITYTH